MFARRLRVGSTLRIFPLSVIFATSSITAGRWTKIDEGREEQSTFVAETLGIKRNVEELQEKEKQPFLDCQWNGQDEREGKIKKKKARRKEGQILTENEEGKKKKARMFTRKEKQKQRDDVSSGKKERTKKLNSEGN